MSNFEAYDVTIPAPGAHGGDAEPLAHALGIGPDQILDLSMTMNPLAPDVATMVRDAAPSVHRYPNPSRASDALADALGVNPGRVLLTNGGAEAIALVAKELGSAQVIAPEFSLWRRHLRVADDTAPARRVRSNPNNPTGRLASANDVAVAWDEAFYPLATGRWTRGDAERGALVVGSLTKLFACPGLRLGYVLGPDSEVIERLAASQPMWSVNSLALAVLPNLLRGADLEAWALGIRALRSVLVERLRSFDLDVIDTDAPWVLVTNAAWLRDALAHHGVLVRDCSSFSLVDTVRIAVPDEGGLARLASALDAAVARRP